MTPARLLHAPCGACYSISWEYYQINYCQHQHYWLYQCQPYHIDATNSDALQTSSSTCSTCMPYDGQSSHSTFTVTETLFIWVTQNPHLCVEPAPHKKDI